MRLGIGITLLASLVAVGCDEGPAPTDGGSQPGTDSGPRVDAGGGGEDAGPLDSGTPLPDGGPVTCSTTLPALGHEEIAPGQWGGRVPVGVVQPPGEATDLYVVDQLGEIVIVRDGAILPTPFLEVDVDFSPSENERGLLGLAFHPQYADNGRFFVYYTATEGGRQRNILGEFHRTAGDVADPDEVRRPIDEEDPYWNHNGGQIAFGPDGFLYVAMGDGGYGGDRDNRALDLQSPYGKIHRLDVDGPADFVPADNPFATGVETVWAYGLRNPWRFSFDRMTGDLWIADVGQNAWEEINFQPASSSGGENYGWSAYEGAHTYSPNASRLGQATNHTPPILDYAQSGSGSDPIRNGRAVTGGYVYRGSAIPGLRGWYVFGDTYSPDHAAFRYCDGEVVGFQRVTGLNPNGSGASNLTSFGEDGAGELYITGFGYVARIVAR